MLIDQLHACSWNTENAAILATYLNYSITGKKKILGTEKENTDRI